MVKKIKGIRAKNYFGYRSTWETGPAAKAKKKQRLLGRNFPST